MKAYIIIILFLLGLSGFSQEGQKTHRVSETIASAKSEFGEFQSFEVFKSTAKNTLTDYSKTLKDGVVFELDHAKVRNLLAENPKQINLSVPFRLHGEIVTLDLIQVNIFAPDFKAITDNGDDITNEIDFGKHYRGVISGDEHSLVSISIFENQINGFIADHEGSYTLGKIKTSNTEHILFKDSDLNIDTNFNCVMEDDGVGYTLEQITSPTTEMDPGDEVDIYIEAGQSVFNTFNQDLPDTVAFLTSLFAQSYVLYANDGVLMRTSNMMIWVNQDPYNGADFIAQLNKFQAQTDILNGDLGSLVEMDPVGGIAASFNGICSSNSDNSLCYAGLVGTTIEPVPIYSINVHGVTHEIGHLLGSRHTHACVWNGNNTAIDGCAGFTEGGCPVPGIPPEGGTIMSYCADVDFNLGFGPQPRAVILNNIETVGNCLDEEDTTNPPVAVCKTHRVILDGSGPVAIDVSDIEGGSYDDDAIVSMIIDTDNLDCDDVGFAHVNLMVTDTDGLTSTCTAYVEVIDNTAVSIACPEDIVVGIDLGTTYELPDFQGDITVSSVICNNAPYIATQQSPTEGTQLEVGVHEITIGVLLADGSVDSCSFEITVEETLRLEDNVLSSLVIYPNPAVDKLYVNNPKNLELESISIYDMVGRLIKRVDLKDSAIEKPIDVSELPQANYFAIIEGTQGKLIRQLIIK